MVQPETQKYFLTKKNLLLQGSGNGICNPTNYYRLSALPAPHKGLIHYALSWCPLLWMSVSVLSEPHTQQGCTEQPWHMQGKSALHPQAPVEKCNFAGLPAYRLRKWLVERMDYSFRGQIEAPAEMLLVNQIVIPEQSWHTPFMQRWREQWLLENLLQENFVTLAPNIKLINFKIIVVNARLWYRFVHAIILWVSFWWVN